MPHSNAQFPTTESLDLNEKSDCLVVACRFNAKRLLTDVPLPTELKRHIDQLARQGDLADEVGSSLCIHRPHGVGAQRLLIVNVGKKDARQREIDPKTYHAVCRSAARELAKLDIARVVSTLHHLEVKSKDISWRVYHFVHQCLYARYSFEDYLSQKSLPPKRLRVGLPLRLKPSKDATRKTRVKTAIAQARALTVGQEACRDLANTPPNVCTPEYIARKARLLAKRYKNLRLVEFDQKKIKQEKMEALLAVAQGSINKPRVLFLHHKPAKSAGSSSAKPIVLVGKGVTFDTGGISIKPALAMDEMKFDMCGAASVLGAMTALAEMGGDKHVIGVLVCVENMPDANACRPGDIVKTRSGRTVEILNTDAEGRLILCDVLDYVKTFTPKHVIDIATLTGACLVALGRVASGLMSDDEKLSGSLIDAGEKAMDPIWRLPLWPEYSELLKSPVADIANIGGRDAGTITAACFLWKFCQNYSWAHLDIAGTAWHTAPNRVATGRPVSLLFQFLLDD